MPKKDRRKGRKPFPASVAMEEDETASVESDLTDSTSPNSDDDIGTTEAEVYEGKILAVIDLALEKSVHTRINALISLKTGLQKRILTNFLSERHQTLTDIIERSLKKGKGLEQIAAAKLASVLVISLQASHEAERVYATLYSILVVIIQDPSASLNARQEVANTLAILAFIACPDPSDLPSVLNILHNVFCGSLPKGNGELPTLSPSMIALHSAALEGVCLLLTLLSPTIVYRMAQKMLEELVPVLDASDVDLRICVGEALAIIHETAKVHDEGFHWKHQRKVIERLEGFVNDSHKNCGKKSRKLQRSTFRDIIHTIEDGEPFSETVYIGPSNQRQGLVLDSWALRFQYQALCHTLEQGVSCHMTYNIMVRDVFGLGPPPVQTNIKLHESGSKRPSKQTPEVKARILARGKNRDNRLAAFCYDD